MTEKFSDTENTHIIISTRTYDLKYDLDIDVKKITT